MSNINKIEVLNVKLDNLTKEELVSQLNQGMVFTPNIDHLSKLQKDNEFYQCYQRANFVVCDSRILLFAYNLLNPRNKIREQIAGSDFFPFFCDFHAKRGDEIRVFLLGGSTESVKAAQENINRRTNSNIVVGTYSPPFGFEKNEREANLILDIISQSQANTLAIGVGAPKQEKWLCRNLHRIPNIRISMAIGATIEFESGNLQRSPKWMSKFGLEWLYRLVQEPKRLAKRYLIDDIPVLFLLLKQRFNLYKNPWS